MKAVIMAAGEGKRLRPLTYTRPKPMIPIAGKPHLQILIEDLKKAGISEVILIVGYLQEQIREFFKNGSEFGINIQYVTQDTQLGTGHAALYAESLVESEPFLLLNGDILLAPNVFSRLINKYNRSSCSSVLSIVKVPNPSSYGIVHFDNKTEEALQIIEKPTSEQIPEDPYTNAGLYVFNSQIFDAIRNTPKSSRGEIEITDSIQRLITRGESIKVFKIEDFWIDLGKPWDLLNANQYLLDQISGANQGTIEKNVTIKGKVIIGEDTIIRSGSYLVGPLYIGSHSDIGPNCYIREYCSIGNNVRVGHACELKNTIIFDNSHVPHLSYIGDSIIGSHVNLGAGTITANLRFDKKSVPMTIKGERMDSGRKKMGAIIGDYVQTGIGTTLMPGVKIGPYSIVGPNMNLWDDIPPRSVVIEKPRKVE
ncbi:MAG: bifunctional sugar-1-phosphate nucleotidylyltransferase/acetyltransferase [Candidatus Helarchaeota archaeon]